MGVEGGSKRRDVSGWVEGLRRGPIKKTLIHPFSYYLLLLGIYTITGYRKPE